MNSSDAAVDAPPDGEGPPKSRRRIRDRWAASRRLVRIAYRDPEHVAERLALFGSERLADESLEWASRVREERPDAPRAEIAEEVRIQTAQVARIDGAVSGTPFFIALVPGYLAYLWQEGMHGTAHRRALPARPLASGRAREHWYCTAWGARSRSLGEAGAEE